MSQLEKELQYFLQQHPEIEQKNGEFRCRNSPHWVKLPKEFSPSLCRLLGVLHGDGNMSNSRVLVSDRCREYHEVIRGLFEKVFGVTPNVFHDKNRNSYYSHFKRKAVYLFLTEVLEVSRGAVRKNLSPPSYEKSWDGELKGSYFGGLLDSEGHVGKLQAKVNFSTTSKPVFDFVCEFLSQNNIKFGSYQRTRRKGNEFEVNVYGKENIGRLLKCSSFQHPEKIARLESVLSVH